MIALKNSNIFIALNFVPSGSEFLEASLNWHVDEQGRITSYKTVWKRNDLWHIATFTQALGKCWHMRGTEPMIVSDWSPSIFKFLLAERSQWSFLSRGMKTVVKDYLDNIQ